MLYADTANKCARAMNNRQDLTSDSSTAVVDIEDVSLEQVR